MLKRIFCCLFMVLVFGLPLTSSAESKVNIPILCYHNFNPVKPGSMNLTPARFEEQMKWLKQNGFTPIPLKEAVEYLQGARNDLPSKPVVITADDGWQSQYIYLVPLAKKYSLPITFFIYPETISSGKNAMTWEELKELQTNPLFDIESHTYWHPNFKQEKRRLSAANFEKFVNEQLVKSKQVLEDKLGTKITLLAWPFGIYDSYLEQQAAKAGYSMAFSIDYRGANKSFRPEAQPRFMIIQTESMQTFANIMNSVMANRL